MKLFRAWRARRLKSPPTPPPVETSWEHVPARTDILGRVTPEHIRVGYLGEGDCSEVLQSAFDEAARRGIAARLDYSTYHIHSPLRIFGNTIVLK